MRGVCSPVPSEAVGEGELLEVTAGAGLGLVTREALVVEEMPAELDLGVAHRVVVRHEGHREALAERPHELVLRRAAGDDDGNGEEAGAAHHCTRKTD